MNAEAEQGSELEGLGLALMSLESLQGDIRRQVLEEPELRSLIEMVVSEPELMVGRRRRHMDTASVVFVCLAMALFRNLPAWHVLPLA